MSPSTYLSGPSVILGVLLILGLAVATILILSFVIRLADGEWPWDSWDFSDPLNPNDRRVR